MSKVATLSDYIIAALDASMEFNRAAVREHVGDIETTPSRVGPSLAQTHDEQLVSPEGEEEDEDAGFNNRASMNEGAGGGGVQNEGSREGSDGDSSPLSSSIESGNEDDGGSDMVCS